MSIFDTPAKKNVLKGSQLHGKYVYLWLIRLSKLFLSLINGMYNRFIFLKLIYSVFKPYTPGIDSLIGTMRYNINYFYENIVN